MKESERLEVLARIENDKNKLQRCEEVKTEIKQLEQDEKIKHYNSLLYECRELNSYLMSFNSDPKQMEYLEFLWAFSLRLISDRGQGFSHCNHPFWFYLGSYGLELAPHLECYREDQVESEQDPDFTYNKYGCPECGRVISVKDWKSFEAEEKIYILNIQNFDFNQRKYYELLLNNDVEKSQERLVKDLKRI